MVRETAQRLNPIEAPGDFTPLPGWRTVTGIGECMFAVAGRLRFVIGPALFAGMVMFAAMQPASAQASSTVKPQNIGIRSDCPVERHPFAINPDVVECHAKFAPLPIIPPEFNKGNLEHLEILRAKGDVLLRQVDRPEACGKGAKVHPDEACAILVYVIDPEFRQAKLPWTYVVRIYRTNRPAEGRLRDLILYTLQSNNSEGDFGPVGAKDEAWKLLAEQRVKTRCTVAADPFVRDSQAPSGQLSRPDSCHAMGQDVRYHPVLLIGRGEARSVLSPASIRNNFGVRQSLPPPSN
jgi:hypothetical protein